MTYSDSASIPTLTHSSLLGILLNRMHYKSGLSDVDKSGLFAREIGEYKDDIPVVNPDGIYEGSYTSEQDATTSVNWRIINRDTIL
jgi:hypothetical protein